MVQKGFPVVFIEMVMSTVIHGKVAVKVNDRIGHFFESRKGLRQGDPMSPILFNIAVDVLELLVHNAVENNVF
jgi:retron-type reverse transcriptase